MFDSQPKMVFMENFRWRKEALGQQNLQLWDLELTYKCPNTKSKSRIVEQTLNLVYVQIFWASNFVMLYSDIYSLTNTKNIF